MVKQEFFSIAALAEQRTTTASMREEESEFKGSPCRSPSNVPTGTG
jgi:hypothetical protein